jgi:hypothetical protein
MTQEGFQVVAELYRLLATFDASAISAASKLPNVSGNLRAALAALYQETTNPQPAVSKVGSPSGTSGKRKNGGSLDPLALVMDKKRFPTKHDLQQLASVLGIAIRADTKDSQERIARRIAACVALDPSAREKLYDLTGAGGDTETAGWIGLIRRGS